MKNMKELTIKKVDICWFSLCFFWILENLAPHSTGSQIGMLLMVLILGIYCVLHKKIKASPVIYAYIGLIAVQSIYLVFGFVADKNVTANNIQTMVICAVCDILIYTFLAMAGTRERVENFTIYTGLISLVVVMWLCRNSLFTGRMAHAYGEGAVSYYFLGKPVAISSNSVATYSCFGFFFSLLKFSDEKKLKWLIYDAIFVIGVILTGSRKGILMLVAFWIIYELIIKANKDIVLKAVGIALAIILGYIVITSVPVFRNIIGERLEDLLVSKLMGVSVSEGSISARARYASYAVDLIKQHSVCGKGLGWFKSVYGNVTENNYYELLVGCGIFGLIMNYAFVPNAIRNICRYKENPYCFAMGMTLIILLFVEWGSVVYLSRDTMIYESLFYLALLYEKNRRKIG